MTIEISEKDVQAIEKMSMEDIVEMYSMTGAGVIIENGRPTKIDMANIEEPKNPIMSVIKEALEDAYESLSKSDEIIEKLAEKLADEIVQMPHATNEERVDAVVVLLDKMGVSSEAIEQFVQKMSGVLGLDYCFDNPTECSIEEEEML